MVYPSRDMRISEEDALNAIEFERLDYHRGHILVVDYLKPLDTHLSLICETCRTRAFPYTSDDYVLLTWKIPESEES